MFLLSKYELELFRDEGIPNLKTASKRHAIFVALYSAQ
jgi:hypothetical protein